MSAQSSLARSIELATQRALEQLDAEVRKRLGVVVEGDPAAMGFVVDDALCAALSVAMAYCAERSGRAAPVMLRVSSAIGPEGRTALRLTRASAPSNGEALHGPVLQVHRLSGRARMVETTDGVWVSVEPPPETTAHVRRVPEPRILVVDHDGSTVERILEALPYALVHATSDPRVALWLAAEAALDVAIVAVLGQPPRAADLIRSLRSAGRSPALRALLLADRGESARAMQVADLETRVVERPLDVAIVRRLLASASQVRVS